MGVIYSSSTQMPSYQRDFFPLVEGRPRRRLQTNCENGFQEEKGTEKQTHSVVHKNVIVKSSGFPHRNLHKYSCSCTDVEKID